MLQSIPDPFDSYGPPRDEDQIFSILPPLSILTNAPSSSTSSLASTPENEPLPELSTSHSWEPTNGGFSPESKSQWPDLATPTSTSPPSISPPSTIHRHLLPVSSGPGHQRKSDSRRRNRLSMIDETQVKQPSKEGLSPQEPALPPTLNGNAPTPNNDWPFEDPENGDETGGDTPRNLDLIIPQLTQPPPADAIRGHHDLLDDVPIPLMT